MNSHELQLAFGAVNKPFRPWLHQAGRRALLAATSETAPRLPVRPLPSGVHATFALLQNFHASSGDSIKPEVSNPSGYEAVV